jgi:ubiquitin carboxyl-terminal hydrolase 1
MEYLQDANCRKCSFKTTIKALSVEIETLNQQSKKQHKSNKKRDLLTQLVTMEKAKMEIEHRLNTGRIEEEHDQDKLPLLQSASRMSSKQVMFAKPPQVLCLHINRSAYLNTGAVYKNTCHIQFPEILDVSPFSTNGTLNTQPNVPISATLDNTNGCHYRLMSVIVHYGSHSFGHFVAFKRRIYADPCQCHECTSAHEQENWKCQNSWYRISDSKVDECSIDDVMRANPYMLLYELIDNDDLESITSEEEDEAVEEEEDKDNSYSYNHIPADDATKEALRIANSLMMGDQEDLLLVK